MADIEFRGRRFDSHVELSLEIIGGTWKIPILWRLKDRTLRYGQLKKSLGRITHRSLTEQLRELERDGLLVRTVYPVIPPKVEYALSDKGRTAIPVIERLRRWGQEYAGDGEGHP